MADEQDGPDEDHGPGVLGYGKTLDEEIGWDGPKQIAKIEDGCYPTVPLAFKTEVGDEVVG